MSTHEKKSIKFWLILVMLYVNNIIFFCSHVVFNLIMKWPPCAHMMSNIKVYSSTTYHILLAELGEIPMKLYDLKLTTSFQPWLAHLLVSQSSNITLPTPFRTRGYHLAQTNNHEEGIMGSISLGNMWHRNNIKNHIRWYQGGFSR